MIWEKPVTNPEEARGRVLAGKCLCGAVHYTVADECASAANCNCSNCRRTTGSAFKPFAGIARDRLRLGKGGDKLMIFGGADNHDAHCNRCGSLLYSVVRDGGFVHVAWGPLVEIPPIRPPAPIFVGSKAPCFPSTAGFPH